MQFGRALRTDVVGEGGRSGLVAAALLSSRFSRKAASDVSAMSEGAVGQGTGRPRSASNH